MRRVLLWSCVLLCACPPPSTNQPIDSGVTWPDGGPGALTVAISAPAQSELTTNAAVNITVVSSGSPQLIEILADGTIVKAMTAPPYTYTAQPTQTDSTVSFVARATRGVDQMSSSPLVIHFDRTAPAIVGRSPEHEAGGYGLRRGAFVVVDDFFPPEQLVAANCSLRIDDGPLAGTALPFDFVSRELNPGVEPQPGLPVMSLGIQARDAWPEDGGFVSQNVHLRASFDGFHDDAGNALTGAENSWVIEPWESFEGTTQATDAIAIAGTADGHMVYAYNQGTTLRVDTDAEGNGFTQALNSATGAHPQLAINAQNEVVAGWLTAGFVHVARFTDGGWLEYSTDANPRTPQDAGVTAANFALALRPDGSPVVAVQQSSGAVFHLQSWAGTRFETLGTLALAAEPDGFVFDVDAANHPALALSIGGNVRFVRWNGSGWVSLSGATATASDTPAISSATGFSLSMVFEGEMPIIAAITGSGVTIVRSTLTSPTTWTMLPIPQTTSYGLRLRNDAAGLLIGTLVNGVIHVDRYDGNGWQPFAAPYGTNIDGWDFAMVTPTSIAQPAHLLGPHTRTAAIIVHDATSTRVMRASR